MEIEEAKKKLKSYLNWEEIHGFSKGPNDLAIETILSELKKQDEEIKYWKEQAEGYQGLAEQIKENFENRDRWE